MMSYYYTHMSRIIIEKKIGITGDYQYRAIRSRMWAQKFWHKNKFEVLWRTMRADTTKTVLDLGTGSGNFELLFAKKFGHIVGVDYNEEALAFLKTKLKARKIVNVDLVQSDIRKLPLAVTRSKYDYVVLVDVIEHIRVSEARKLLKNIRGMLKKDGQIILITPNYKSVWVPIESLSDLFSVFPKFAGKQHLSKFDPKTLTDTLIREGFRDVEIKTFNLFSYISPFSGLNNLLLNLELRWAGNWGCLVCASAVNR